jgi:N-acetylglutamate synthase-like GNAT family acetyltransferase
VLSWWRQVVLADFVLRPAAEDDFPAIRDLIRMVGINPMGLDWHRFVIAVDPRSNLFLGCGQIKPHSDGSLELASIAVQPEQRGRGIARTLIEHLLAESPRPLYLTCRAGLEPFYQKFGFYKIGLSQMPPYFRRLSRLAGVFEVLSVISEPLFVMRLD